MTNQEAIIIIGNLEDKDILFNPCDVQDAKTMAIKALEQEPSGDLISRQAVLDGIDTYIYKAQSTGTQDDFYSFAELVVKQLPPVNPQEPKTGHWILDETDNSITCDKCGCLIWANDISNGDAHYCPNCGCRMVEPQESEDKE